MSSLDESFNRPSCPYLGSLDSNSIREEYVDYPSFENHCFVGPTPEPIMLTDQATFCLSSGFKHCPLFQPASTTVDSSATFDSATGATDSSRSTMVAGVDPMLHAIAEMEEGDLAMLILRTADNLRHIRSLKRVFPEASLTSATSIDLILRSPVAMEYE